MKICVPAIAVLWTLSVTLMATAIASDGDADLARAALLLGLMACVPTVSLVVSHYTDKAARRTIVAISEVVGRADAARGTSRIHR